MTFGGLGQNIFNPAIAARVFLLLSFPTAMTSWDYTPTGLFGSVDAVSGPTLLGLVAEQGLDSVAGLDWTHLLINTCGGSAGELSALALIAGFERLGRSGLRSRHWSADYAHPLFRCLSGRCFLRNPHYEYGGSSNQ